MQRIILSIVLILFSVVRVDAAELAIVTAETGYLLDDKDQIAGTVPYYHVFEIDGQDGDFVRVQHEGARLRIHAGCVHRTSQVDYVTDEHLPAIREVFDLLQQADALSTAEKSDEAIETAREAAVKAREAFSDRTTLEAWVMQYEAFLLHKAGQTGIALDRLTQCLSLLKELDAEDHLHAADVRNTLGVVLDAEDRSEEAIEAYQQAMIILLTELGLAHHDTAVVSMNFAYACENADMLAQAAYQQNIALVALQKVLPASAVALPEGYLRLGQLHGDNDNHRKAVTNYEAAIALYEEHHPELLTEIADVRTNMIHSFTQLGEYALAEASCLAVLQLALEMEPDDAVYYRRDAILRMGTIDYDQKDYSAALRHYQQAATLTDPDQLKFDDAVSYECIGTALLELGEIKQAVTALEKAIDIYAVTEGNESNEVLDTRDMVFSDLRIPYEEGGAFAVVAMPKGYLTNEAGEVVATVPGLTVLPVIEINHDTQLVKYQGETAYIASSQVHSQRNVPGYGVGAASTVSTIMSTASDALNALQQKKTDEAEAHIKTAIALCETEYPGTSSLSLWLKVLRSGILLRTRGVEAADKSLSALEADVESLNSESYPLFVEYAQAQAAVLAAQQKKTEATEILAAIIDQATERYTVDHAVILNLKRTLGIYCFQANQQEDAINHLREALQIAQDIYPDEAEIVSETVSDLSLVLTQTDRFEAAAELLEDFLEGDPKLPKETHALMVSTLGKVYARLGKADDARTLLKSVIQVQSNGSEDIVQTPSGLLAYSELGRLELADNNWQTAADFFRKALNATTALDVSDGFEASELHRQLAEALQQLGDREGAVTELTDVLRIYDVLGGTGSPQADDIRKQLQTLKMQPAELPAEVNPNLVAIAQLLVLAPDSEQMFQLTETTSVSDQPADSAASIMQLEAGAKVWSLLEQDGYHSIYVPESNLRGWVPASQLVAHSKVLVEKGREKLAKELRDQPESALQECVDAFEKGMAAAENADVQVRIDTISESLAAIRSHYQYSNPFSALLYEQLLKAYQAVGDSENLARTADESLSHLLSGHGYDHPLTAVVRFIRAENARRLGDDNRCASELEEVLKICQKRFGPDDPRTQAQQLGYAANRVRLGFFAEAEKIYRQALTVSGDDPRALFIRSLASAGLGLLKATERQSSAAAKHLEIAADGYSDLETPVPSLMVQAVVALAFSIADSDEALEAMEILDRVADMEVSPENQTTRLSHNILMAKIAARLQYGSAMELADRALQFARSTFGEDNFLVANAWQVRGAAEAGTGGGGAWKAFDVARRMAHQYAHETVTFLPKNRQLSFLTEDAERLNESLSLAFVDENSIVMEKTAEWLINGHNINADVLGKVRHAKAMLSEHPDQRAFVSWQRAQQQVAQVPLQVATSAPSEYLQEQISELRQEAESELKHWPANVRNYLTSIPEWLSIEKARECLAADEVLLIFRRVDEPESPFDPFVGQLPDEHRQRIYAAWIIPAKDAGDVQVVTVGHAVPTEGLVDQSLNVLRYLAQNAQTGQNLTDAMAEERAVMRKLYKQLWNPISEHIPEGTRRLTLVPDGCLHNVPWIALVDGRGMAILDQYRVRHLSNPREIAASADSSLNLSRALVLSAPESLAGDAALTNLPKDTQQALTARTRGSRLHLDKATLRDAIDAGPDLVDEFFDLLAQRRKKGIAAGDNSENDEFEATFQRLFSEPANLLTAEQASEYRFFDATRPAALHIDAATYANVPQRIEVTADFVSCESRSLIETGHDAHFNPLMQCGVLLSGYGIDSATHHLNDGVLTGEEIVSQDLRGTRLVTLSVAPRSVTGQSVDEEAVSLLPQAFLAAGARSVVSGIWPLKPNDSNELLTLFYEQLSQGKSTADALRAAQLKVRDKNQGRVPAALWASFRLTGEDLLIDGSRANPAPSETTTKVESDDDELRVLARSVLKAYQAKDVKKLLSFSPEGTPSESVLRSFSPGNSRYDSLFAESAWRWQAVAAWDGKLRVVYYTDRRKPAKKADANMAHVEFGRSGTELYVVTLLKTDDGWKFDDIHSPDASDLQTP